MSIQIRPAIDLIDGKCVRLKKGDFSNTTVYNQDPLDQAKRFEDIGCQYLHLVDLEGAKSGKIKQYRVLEKIASGTSLKIDFGGGIYADEDIQIAFDSGARQITAGSIAVKKPSLVESWIHQYGSEKIILGMDVLNGNIMTKGWQETNTLQWADFLEEYQAKGINYCISTDISVDGMMTGPSTDWYITLKETAPALKIIASGGVHNMADIVLLDNLHIYGVIVGKALYEGTITFNELKAYMLTHLQ